jgi:hypothetical protein
LLIVLPVRQGKGRLRLLLVRFKIEPVFHGHTEGRFQLDGRHFENNPGTPSVVNRGERYLSQ